jgi:predicted HTH domain antitoxin
LRGIPVSSANSLSIAEFFRLDSTSVEQADRSTTVRKLLSRAIQDWKLDHYSRLYGSSKLTLARAAPEARVSLWEMMDYVKTKKITAQYDLEDFQRDLKTVAASERR